MPTIMMRIFTGDRRIDLIWFLLRKPKVVLENFAYSSWLGVEIRETSEVRR